MNKYFISEISRISIHNVGNKLNDDGVRLSKQLTDFDKVMKDLLISYFINPFKSDEYYNFYHDSDIGLNEVFVYVKRIFDSPISHHEQSINLAKHLYSCSTHPKIMAGEFYTVLFRDCVFEGTTVDAVGLFKSEIKDVFLKVDSIDETYEVQCERGINIDKLDKGCIIFNVNQDKGYVVTVVDNTSKGGSGAVYWMDDFLHLSKREDDYQNTQNILSFCKKFITKELPHEFEMSKSDQAGLLNKSIQFFKDNDSFDLDEFSHSVIEKPELIEKFHKYKEVYQERSEVSMANSFTISSNALKKQARVFRSVLKLDKNFDIYIHGGKNLIERGVEKDGRKYYKIFYEEEQ